LNRVSQPIAALGLVGVCLLITAPEAQAQVRWEPSIGLDYSRGSYGAAEDTEVIYAPVGLRASTTRWRFDANVPYLTIEGPAGAVVGGVVIPGAGPVVKRSGLGDVTLSGTYQLVEPQAGRTQWEVGATVKLPTADDDLGTGKADYQVQLGVRQPVGDKLTLMGSVGYQWLGDPAAFELEDGPTAMLGVNYAATPRRNFGVQVNYRNEYLAGFEEQVVVNPYFRLDAASGWFVTGYATAGLTETTPDYGVGFVLGRAF
jgi:hypothetical protein